MLVSVAEGGVVIVIGGGDQRRDGMGCIMYVLEHIGHGDVDKGCMRLCCVDASDD